MKYYVTVEGETREVELTEDGVRLDGRPVEAEIARLPGGDALHLRLGHRGWLLSARREESGWMLEHGGRRASLSVEDERARRIRELAGVPPPSAAAPELRAPMPGLVVRIHVEAGQPVEPGDAMVVIEAMKMENELRAPAGGTVASVEVEEGQTVNQNDLLVAFEA